MASLQDLSQNIADSTDWLHTPLAPFAQVEAALRCQVCKELYDTPMITHCCHTFCSKCIRRCLSGDGKCPACRSSSQESQLRSNWGIEELVNAFKIARPAALELARDIGEPPVKKRKLDSTCAADINRPQRRPTRQSSRITSRSRQVRRSEETESETEPEAPEENETGMEYKQDDGLVPCPMCNMRMKEAAVFSHLDRCTGESLAPSGTPAVPVYVDSLGLQRQLSKPSNNLVPLPSLSYGLLKDGPLRKKLSELGISAQGSRSLLEARHREWVTIYNANCDAAVPRRKGDLLQDLSSWERAQNSKPPLSSHIQSSDVRSKDFDRAAYGAKQKSQFDELIANARLKAFRTTAQSTEQLGSDLTRANREQSPIPEDKCTVVGSKSVLPARSSCETMQEPLQQNAAPLNRMKEADNGKLAGHAYTVEEISESDNPRRN